MRILRTLALLLAVLLMARRAAAHSAPESTVLLDLRARDVGVELRLPLSELAAALGGAVASGDARAMVERDFHVASLDGAAWTVATSAEDRTADEVVVLATLTPPSGRSPRAFRVTNDVIGAEVVNHISWIGLRNGTSAPELLATTHYLDHDVVVDRTTPLVDGDLLFLFALIGLAVLIAGRFGPRVRAWRAPVGMAGAALLYACSHGSAPKSGAPTSAATQAMAVKACDSGVGNTAAVVDAANAFLAALTPEQRNIALVQKTLANASRWSNFPAAFVQRNGVRFEDMSPAAQAAGAALVNVAAGGKGAALFAEVRAADDAFKRGSDDPLFGKGLYYVSIHGTASTTADWMLQIAGHHFVYNFTYNGKCTSATPLFDGAQPAKFTDRAGQAHDPIGPQRDAMAALFGAVNGAQLAGIFTDMINGPGDPGGHRGPPPGGMSGGPPRGGPPPGMSGATDSKYPSKLTYPTTGRGASVATFSPAEKALVQTAIEAWVKNAADPIAASLLAAYESDDALSQTYVGYSGASDLSKTSSYGRIDGPRVWIEFTVQEGTTDGQAGHYHTIWRDKAADYGADFATP